jgi:class 3 adenylate cyclase/tetratricopeptide (TPR) repeat protein
MTMFGTGDPKLTGVSGGGEAGGATCPSCGHQIGRGDRFCPSCGQPLHPLSDERRIVTVLFADLVGFTGLAETRDPEEVKNLVDGIFAAVAADVAAFGGRVDKVLGDAIVAMFGAPVAHEDDADRAVRAGLQMLRTLADWGEATGVSNLAMRVGINTGEVLVGSLRADGDYTAMGDVVNIANRLQGIAAPGQVVVGPGTFQATRRAVRYSPLGEVEAKGRGEPIRAWVAERAVLPPGARPSRGRSPMVGRERELALLGQAVDTAVTRERAHLLLVIAEAGMGKTRLAEEVAARAERTHGAVVFEGRCVPYGEANVWWPVAEAVRHGFGIAQNEPVGLARDKTSGAVALVLGESTPADEIARVTNGILHLLGYESALAGIDASRAREEVNRAILALLDGWADREAVVIVLSDLHWADDVVLEMIDTMLERAAGRRVAFIATARSTLFDRWQPQPGRHNTVVLNLDPLGRDAAEELLDALGGRDYPAGLRTVLLDRSGGNPFFLEELVALVGEQAQSPGSSPGERVEITSPTLSELPDNLRGLVAARLDGLTVDERRVLADAAVLGRRGEVGGLRIMAHESGAPEIDAGLEGLVAKELLVVDRERWSFRSDLVREVVYSMMTKSDRAKRHAGVAKWMEINIQDRPPVDRIAHHYATAARLAAEIGPTTDRPANWAALLRERALTWLEKALERARETELEPVAQRVATKALELGDGVEPERRLRFLLARAKASSNLRQLERANADICAAVELAERSGDEHARARALAGRGDIEQKSSELAASAASLVTAIDIFRRLGDRQAMAEAMRTLGMTRMFAGDDLGAVAVFREALEIFEELGDRRGEAWVLQNLAWHAFTSGRGDHAESWLTDSIDTFRQIGDAGGLGWALGLLAWVRYWQGRFDEAEKLGQQMLNDAQQRGDKWAEAMMQVVVALVHLWTGRTLSAHELAEDAATTFREQRDWYGALQALGALGRIRIALGRIDEGIATLIEAVGVGERAPSPRSRRIAAVHLAAGVAQAGEPSRLPPGAGPALAEEDEPALPFPHHAPHRTAAAGRFADHQTATLDGSAAAVGHREAAVAAGLLFLQVGDVGSARSTLEHSAGVLGDDSPSLAAALALARTADGEVDGARRAVDTVAGAPAATFADRVLALVALGLLEAGTGAVGPSRAALGQARQLAAATEDRLTQALVHMAEARAAERLGEPAEVGEARATLADMGLIDLGWDTAYRLAVAGAAAGAGAGAPPQPRAS